MSPRMNFYQATFETLKALLILQSPAEEQLPRTIPVPTDEDARSASQSVARPRSA
jgi:hypothetical protein